MISRLVGILILIIEKFTFYPFFRKVYNSVFPDKPVIIDVGTNRGQFIDFLLKVRKDSTIYSFEANPKFNDYLKKKYRKFKDIHLFNKGVSSVNGEIEFFINYFDETSSFEKLDFNSKYLKTKSKVLGIKPENIVIENKKIPTIKLSDFIKEVDLKVIDLIKLDVEGHEYECLKGLFDRLDPHVRINRIQFEYHFDDMYLVKIELDSLDKILKENGFILEHSFKHKFGDFYDYTYRNNAS